MSLIRVMGWYDKANIGDEAYKIAFPRIFSKHDFSFDISKAPNLILGGGDILNETFLKNALKYPAKRRIALSVSANSNTPIDLIKKLDDVYVRDVRSVKYLTDHGVSCTYMPDVATCLQSNKTNGMNWLRKKYQTDGLELYEKKVGIVFNAHLYHGNPDILARDFNKLIQVVWDLAKLMDNTMASFVLFPMSTQFPYDDRITNAMTAGRCKFWRKNLVIYDKLNVQETLDLISTFDAVISTRLHASIFSMSAGVPFIDLTHHDKNRGFLETVGLSDWSESYWRFDCETVHKRLKHLLISGESDKNRLEIVRNNQIDVLEQVSNHVRFL
jgi:polysaccharide pyruvyl transferase WcaK-like protein